MTKRQTVALEMRYFFTTLVSDIPARRSATTCARSMSSGARPSRTPSARALRIPALTRSTIRLRSSSAMLPIRVMNIRPIGPLLSIASRADINSIPSSSSSSTMSRKFFGTPGNSVESCNQNHGELTSPCVGHHSIQCRTACLTAGDSPVAVFTADFKASLRGQFSEVIKLSFSVLVRRTHTCVNGCYPCMNHLALRLLRPFLILGSSFRTRLMSWSLHRRTRTPPILCSFGADIVLAAIYRWRLIRLMPSCPAASRVETPFI